MDDETRAYFEEMRRDLSGLRGEVTDLRGEVTGLRGEFSDFRGDVDRRFEALDDKIDSRAEEIRRDFGVLSEALRHDLQTVIEGVDNNTTKLAAHTHSMDVLRDQMNTRFARVRVDLAEIQRARPTRRRPRG